MLVSQRSSAQSVSSRRGSRRGPVSRCWSGLPNSKRGSLRKKHRTVHSLTSRSGRFQCVCVCAGSARAPSRARARRHGHLQCGASGWGDGRAPTTVGRQHCASSWARATTAAATAPDAIGSRASGAYPNRVHPPRRAPGSSRCSAGASAPLGRLLRRSLRRHGFHCRARLRTRCSPHLPSTFTCSLLRW